MYPDPLFKLFGQDVNLYGICMAAGMLGCFVILLVAMTRRKFNYYSSDVIFILSMVGVVLGFVFATLFQSVYDYIENPSAGFHWGGMTVIGGLIGGTVCFLGLYFLFIYVIRPRTKIKWLSAEMNATLTDALPFIPIGITFAHGIGRLGCFFAGCCYGLPTDAWYGLPCAEHYDGNVIPTQLFEMIVLLVLCAVMAVLFFKFNFEYNFAVYPIVYGIWRFCIEFVRNDPRGELIGDSLSPSQIWSIMLVLVGIGFIFLQKYVLSKHMKHPERSDGKTSDVGGKTATKTATSAATASAPRKNAPTSSASAAPEKEKQNVEDNWD